MKVADVPFTMPQQFEIANQRPTDFNSEAVGRGDEAVAAGLDKFGMSMLKLQQNKDMANGELANDKAVSDGMTKIQQGKDYTNAPTQFADVIESQKQAIENSDYDEGVKRHLLHDLGTKQVVHGSQIAAWSYSGQMSDAKDTLNTYVTSMGDQYANAGSDFLRNTIKAKVAFQVQGAIDSKMITTAQAADIMSKVNNEYDSNAAALDVTKNPAATLEKLKDSKQYQYLDGKQRAEYIDHAQNQIKQAQAANEAIAEGAAKDQIDSNLTYGTYSVEKFQAAVSGLKPEMAAIAQKRLALSGDAHSAYIAIQQGTPDERAQALAKYEPKPGADDFQFRQETYDKLESIYSDVNTKITTDPASVVNDQVDKRLPYPQQIEQSFALQEKMGATAPRVFTVDKAKSNAEQYNTLPPDQKAAFVASLKVKSGDYFGQAASELYKAGMKPSFQFADRPTSVITNLAMIDDVGDTKLKESIGEAKWSSISKDVEAQRSFVDSLLPPGAPAQNAQTMNTFTRLAAFYQSRGDSNPVGHAQTDLFGDYTMKGGWAFPSNVTGQLQDNVQAYFPKFIADQKIATPAGMDEEEFKSIILSQAQPRLSADKFHYNFYLNGDRIRDVTGKPISMSVADGVQYKPPVYDGPESVGP
jgi:hypothetical protein